jgi:hypothetical protein
VTGEREYGFWRGGVHSERADAVTPGSMGGPPGSPDTLDRLDWTTSLSFVSHGARIAVRVNEPALLERLTAHLPPGSSPAPAPQVDDVYSLWVDNGGPHRLYHGSATLVETFDLERVFEALESAMSFNVAVAARRGLFVHAGAVGWGARAIVVPGRSMSGKTSLVAALARAGAAYYSDEYAVFDESGRLHAFPGRLSMRNGDGTTGEKLSPEELGLRVGSEPLPVALVAVTDWQRGARWRPRTLSPGQAMLALLDNTVLARERPKLAMTTLGRVVEGSMAVRGKRGEADEVATSLLEHLATDDHHER